MTIVTTKIRVAADRTITGRAPADVPAGEHEAIIAIAQRPTRRVSELPAHAGHWDDAISLRRADLYGDDGR